jgi:hypothetical protein
LLLFVPLLLLQGKVAEHKDQLLQDISAALATLLETPLKEMPVQLLLQVLAALVLAVAILMW